MPRARNCRPTTKPNTSGERHHSAGWQGRTGPDVRTAELFRDVWSALKRADHTLCILHGYEEFPERIGSDVDVISGNPEHIPQILSDRKVATVVQALQHEATAFYYVLCKRSRGETAYIALDVCSDYRRNGRIFIEREVLIKACRPYKFFEIPYPEVEFVYYLIKKLCKDSIDEAQAQRLSQLYGENPTGCNEQLSRFFPREEAKLLARAAERKDWEPVLTRIDGLRRAMLSKLRRERPLQLLQYLLDDYQRRIRRVFRPTGLMIVFLGVDGSGKSTVLDYVMKGLGPVFRRKARYHLRPPLRRRKGRRIERRAQAFVAEPHAQALRGRVSSLAKLAFWWSSYTFGYLNDIFPQLIRSTLVVFDRYYYDILVDTRRYRYRGPLWLARLVSKVVPRPHLVILLDAPPDVLFARKQEISFEEVRRQREEYLKLVRRLDNGYAVDASKPLDEVVSEVEEIILDYMAARTARRTGVDKNR